MKVRTRGGFHIHVVAFLYSTCHPLTYGTSLLLPFLLQALEEARDIHMHLKPLKAHFEDMEEADYLELHKRFSPFFHTLCLVWTHSHHYQQPARLVVLLQEVANLLIELVYLYVLLISCVFFFHAFCEYIHYSFLDSICVHVGIVFV